MTESTIIPYLAASDARAALEFYKSVFGAVVVDGEYYEMDDGRLGHVSMKIGDASLFLSDEFVELGAVSPTTAGASTVAVVIHVADADDTYDRAVEAGATPQRPVQNQNGARSGWFLDPWGHRWSPTSPEKPEN